MPHRDFENRHWWLNCSIQKTHLIYTLQAMSITRQYFIGNVLQWMKLPINSSALLLTRWPQI